jgi:hypothetical protein
VSNASNLANIALPDFGIADQILTSTGNTTTPVFSAIPTSDVNTTFLAGSGTVIEVGVSNSSVKVNLLQCPDWKVGQTGRNLYNETGANRVSRMRSLSSDFAQHIDFVIAQNAPLSGNGGFRVENFVPTPSITPGAVGCCVMLDGRVFFSGYSYNYCTIWDPKTNTIRYATGTASGWSGAPYANAGCLLLADGRVLTIPHNGAFIRIYNPATDTIFTNSKAIGGGAPGAYEGGVVMQDGKVFLCGSQSGIAHVVYDPVSDVITTPTGAAATAGGAYKYESACLLRDGRVFVVPYGANIPLIYNPSTNNFTTPNGNYDTTDFNYQGGVLLPDGRVFCVPHHATTARIYDPVTNTTTTPSGTYGAANTGGLLLPDGRVFCAPGFSSSGLATKIYDPVTDTLSTPCPGVDWGGSEISNVCMLPDGTIVGAPLHGTTIFTMKVPSFAMFSPQAVTSPNMQRGY